MDFRPLYDVVDLRQTHNDLMSAPGWRRVSPHVEALVSSSFGRDPIVRSSLRLRGTAAEVARFLITDITTTMTQWNQTVQQVVVVDDDGHGVRRLQMRTRFPWPFLPREDDFEQRAVTDEHGALWELSRCTQPSPPPPSGCERTFVRFASKQIKDDNDRETDGDAGNDGNDGTVCLQVLWHVAMGGVLDRLPLFIKRRAVADNLAHECERLIAVFNARERAALSPPA